MRFITIDQAEPGMMLAKSIYDYETRTDEQPAKNGVSFNRNTD